PAGIRLTPVGITPADLAPIAELVTAPDLDAPEAPPPATDEADIAETDLETDIEAGVDGAGAGEAGWAIVVRLLGRVEAADRDGATVTFERSKTKELVAWLATHRDRGSRAAARTALWDQDVRDATFANVVSEARRALARLVPPPEG